MKPIGYGTLERRDRRRYRETVLANDEQALRRELRYLLRELSDLLPRYGLRVEAARYRLARDTLLGLSTSYCDGALGVDGLGRLLTDSRRLEHTLLKVLTASPKGRPHRPHA